MAVNPYDIETPKVTDDMIADAQQGAFSPTPAVANASTATNQDASAYGYNPASATAGSYDPSTVNDTYWNVDNNQTVAGQVEGIINKNSGLMQQAQTNALQQMQGRGLLNSSMAIGAGQNAVIANALPIAQADAATYAGAAKYRADVANTNQQFNATAENAAGQFNTGQQNEIALANQNAANTAGQFNATTSTDVSKFNASQSANTSQFNAQQQNAIAEANAGREQQSNMTAAESANALLTQQLDNAFKARIASADAQTKVELQQIDADTRLSVADIEAQYKGLMQSTASATELFQQTLKNIETITGNPDLSSSTVKSAIARQIDGLRDGMSLIDALNTNVSGLSNLINF